MERKMSWLRAPNMMAVPFFAALGLTVVGGCSSDNGNNKPKDANADVSGGSDTSPVDGPAKTDLPSSPDLQPGEANRQPDVGIDGPKGVDVGPGVDLAIEKPITVVDGGEPDVPVGGAEAGTLGEAGQGTGGAGGSTVVGGNGGSTVVGGNGGSTAIGGTGGTGGVPATGGTTGGSTGSLLTGWPLTSLEVPHTAATITCNGAAQPAPEAFTFTLRNTGSATTTFTGVSFSGATGYSVDLTAGTSKIGPGESKVVTITPPAIPFTLTPPATISSVLTLTTDEPTGNMHTIFLAEVVHGARLAWGDGAAPIFLGGAAPGGPLTQTFTVLNTGDQPTTVDLTSSYPSFVISTPTAAVTIPAGGSVTRTLTFTAPAQEGNYAATIALVPPATNNLCAPVPEPWSATAMSLLGYPQFTPSGGEFDFSGFCGTTPASRSISIKNVGTDTLRWLPTIADSNPCFTITHPTVAPGTDWLNLGIDTTDTIDITPTAIAANATTTCDGRLDVKFQTTAGGTEHTNSYVLRVVPLGANITVSPATLDFGTTNIVSPATTVPAQTLTIHNDGFRDTVGNANTTVTITLASPSSQFVFDNGSQTRVVEVPASHGVTENDVRVGVRYQRPELGPYSGSADNFTATWTVAPGSACNGLSGTAAALTGRVTEGVVTHGFVDGLPSGDFGTAYCGAAPAARDFYVTNIGTGPIRITSAQVSTGYFAVSPTPTSSNPVVVTTGNSATFTITPQAIDGASLVPGDLSPSSPKFATNLVITTDAPETLGDPRTAEIITQQITMHAQGIWIDSVDPTNWAFQQVVWPTNTSGSNLTAQVVNSGNVPAVAALSTTISKFSLPATGGNGTIAGGGNPMPLYALFGPFTNCDTESTTYTAPGTLSFSVAGQAAGIGVCHGASVSLNLSGAVSQAGLMCSTGQHCAGPAGAGQCVCDPTSCAGCCEGNTCVAYANQTRNKDAQNMGCGLQGAACAACDDWNNSTYPADCVSGICRCPVNAVYCPATGLNRKCVPTSGSNPSDPDNCGSCGTVCSPNNMQTRTCTAATCDGACAAGYADCNGNKRTDGCEINTETNANNCGACGTVCSNVHIPTPTCAAHVCNGTCETGWDNCDGTKQANGCNVQLNTNDHCGTCAPCGTGQRCDNGTCVCDTASGCVGCCSGNTCVTPIGNGACGINGGTCNVCVSPQVCDQPTGACVSPP